MAFEQSFAAPLPCGLRLVEVLGAGRELCGRRLEDRRDLRQCLERRGPLILDALNL